MISVLTVAKLVMVNACHPASGQRSVLHSSTLADIVIVNIILTICAVADLNRRMY